MLRTLRDRNLLVPTLMTLVGLAVLLSLGAWQLQRKQWKDGLIADIQRGLSEIPAPLDDPPGLWRVLGQREYHPVTAKGVFRHADERHLFAVEDGVAGWHIYTPLDMANGLTVIVNRGFVTEELKDPDTRKAGEIAGEVTLTGLVRQPGKATWFTPAADRARNVWFWRDLDGMVASFTSGAPQRQVLPFFIDAKADPPNPGGWPKGGITHLDIPNRHLEYAITWFGLAAALLAVFAVYAWPRLRSGA
jgi:surfeit locus 1 family protein